MNKFFAIVCLAVLIETAYSAVQLQKPVQPPAKFAGQPGCYSPQLDIMLPVNQQFSPQKQSVCTGYRCRSDGITEIDTCGAVQDNGKCKVTQDLSKPYPDCCKQYSCPNE